MCGICGKVYLDTQRRASAAEIELMRDRMLHRGPDAAGTYLDRHVGLGHRRLSIIDLAASTQPMANDDRSVVISFNGEIYNYRELREELIGKGHHFRTDGDTEVILRLYEELGERCVERLRGMFAFAIWDARSASLFLARDRIGVKPLYYTLNEQAFVFASELKGLMGDERVRSGRELDVEAAHGYFSFLSVPDPLTIYRGIYKLPAAHTLTLRGGRVELRRYWDVEFRDATTGTEEEWRERVLDALRDAVRVRLVADVPLGAFLSGGIDSSSVVALMAGLVDRPVKTFSIGFTESAYNEASDAALVARHLGTDHTELMLTPSTIQPVIPALLQQFDEPFADSSAIPTYFVSKLAREQVTVALSGDGGDELFGGYPWRQVRPRYQRVLSRLPLAVRSGISALGSLLPRSVPGSNYLRQAHVPYERYILDALAVFDQDDRKGLYSGAFAAAVADRDPFAAHLVNLAGRSDRSWPARMMQYDLKTYLPNDILTKVDRMSMYVSLEAREPLLDHHLVELAAQVPSRLKIRGNVAKYILKQAVAPLLPAEVLTKRKQGFSIPLSKWMRNELRGDVLDALYGGNRHGLFDRQAVTRMTDDFLRGNDLREHQIWSLYAFELWHQRVDARLAPGAVGIAPCRP